MSVPKERKVSLMESIIETFAPVTALIQDFVSSFDEEYTVEMGEEFAANLNEDIVYYSIIYAENGGRAFYENFVKRFPKCDGMSLMMLSILHEIGHLETEWDMVDDTAVRARIRGEKDNERYFNLHNEFIATEWAGNWATSHMEEAKAWDKKIMNTYMGILDNIIEDSEEEDE